MSFTINHVTLVGGNLVRDAELKFTNGGTAKLTFDIAMNRSYKNNSTGEIQEEVSYFRIINWGNGAKAIANIMRKGQKVAIEGRLLQRKWNKDDGSTVSIIEIIADKVILIGNKSKPPQENSDDGFDESGF